MATSYSFGVILQVWSSTIHTMKSSYDIIVVVTPRVLGLYF